VAIPLTFKGEPKYIFKELKNMISYNVILNYLKDKVKKYLRGN